MFLQLVLYNMQLYFYYYHFPFCSEWDWDMREMVLVSLVGPGASTGYSERSPRAPCDALEELISRKNA
jgi:hypothetical protein